MKNVCIYLSHTFIRMDSIVAYMQREIDVHNMSQDTTIRVSEELAEELYQRKGRATSYEEFLWQVLDRVDRCEEEGKAGAGGGGTSGSTTGDDSGEGGGVEVWEASEGRGELPEDPPDREQAEVLLRRMDLPGSGEDYERRAEAVLAIYDELRANPGERLSKSHFAALLDDTSVGYAGGFDSLWSNWVKSNPAQGHAGNVLEALPGVEMRGDAYVYEGGE